MKRLLVLAVLFLISCSSDKDEPSSPDPLTGVWKQVAQTRDGIDDSYPCMTENTITVTQDPNIFSERIYTKDDDVCVLSIFADTPWWKDSDDLYYVGDFETENPVDLTFSADTNSMYITNIIFGETVINTYNRQ